MTAAVVWAILILVGSGLFLAGEAAGRRAAWKKQRDRRRQTVHPKLDPWSRKVPEHPCFDMGQPRIARKRSPRPAIADHDRIGGSVDWYQA